MDELTAAGITDPALRESYKECKRLNSLHGKTYYLATLLLPKSKRPHVHALYGFARYADEIVDDLTSTLTHQEKVLVDTVQRFNIPIAYFEAFLHSMAMDLTVAQYETYDDLLEYVYGSAAVIGLQMVQVLGTVEGKTSEALVPAEKLGIAFQLANFIRDVGEDLERGRVYLPMAELRSYGVSRDMLERRALTPQIIEALKFQIGRVRDLQNEANLGINLLSPDSQACIRAASELYCGIVDEVEKIDYQVFTTRAKTSTWRRARVALPAWFQALAAR